MKVLFIAPLPPPTTGHTLASKVFLDELVGVHDVEVVNLGVASIGDGTVTIRRLGEVWKILHEILRKKADADALYLTISESVAGNIKDLLIYCLCIGSLSKMYIHLHGGSIKTELFDRHKWLRRLNASMIRKLAGIVISGQSHIDIFAGMIDRRRIHMVCNFAQDNLFVPEPEVVEKFADVNPLRILYLSGMIPKKGFNELADAYMVLERSLQAKIRVEFAGRFESEADQTAFLGKIAGVEGIRYHGVVSDMQKQQLFSQAHLFCLPTAFLEGQPISILEAYASGCVVLTTGQSGIRDVFESGVNGFEVQERSAKSIATVLARLVGDPAGLLEIAIRNRRLAGSRYRTAGYTSALMSIVGRGQHDLVE